MDFDRVLKKAVARADSGPPTAACLDAETLAAWSDGSLSRRERDAAEAHAADCNRCLSVLAALTTTLPPTPERSWTRWLSPRWVVPLAAATTAAVVWLAVPPHTTQPPTMTTAQRSAETPAASAAPSPVPSTAPPPQFSEAPRDRRDESTLAKRQPSSEAKNVDVVPDAKARNEALDSIASIRAQEEQRKDTKLERQRADQTLAEPVVVPPRAETGAPAAERPAAPAAAAAPPPPADARRFVQTQERPLEIPSPDAQIRWRIRGAIVERSANGGQTWQPQSTGTSTRLAAGAAPSPAICWLVGANGTVLLTTNGGETWQVLPAPEATDLGAVTAADGSRATVTTTTGRFYLTLDGGRTWTLQDLPSQPF